MIEVVKNLIDLINKYGVYPTIWFENWLGDNNLVVEFSIGEFHIQRRFYYVSVGGDTFTNFMHYNPQFDLIIEKMAKDVQDAYKKKGWGN